MRQLFPVRNIFGLLHALSAQLFPDRNFYGLLHAQSTQVFLFPSYI